MGCDHVVDQAVTLGWTRHELGDGLDEASNVVIVDENAVASVLE